MSNNDPLLRSMAGWAKPTQFHELRTRDGKVWALATHKSEMQQCAAAYTNPKPYTHVIELETHLLGLACFDDDDTHVRHGFFGFICIGFWGTLPF